MKRLRIQHLTTYQFAETVTLQTHFCLIRPREGHDVRIESSRLTISPAYQLHWSRDVFDNSLVAVDFLAPTAFLSIASEVVIQHFDETPFDFLIANHALNYPFQYASNEWADLAPFQRPMFPTAQACIQHWLFQLGVHQQSWQTFSLLSMLNQTICAQFRYAMREAAGVQAPDVTLQLGCGSCRDYATLLMEACRCLGFASRFVSGYLHAPATELGNATTHAWAEVYLPGIGWKGFDPTSGLVTSTAHIAVAVSRDPEAIPPVAGSFIGAAILPILTVNVQVNAL